MPKIIDNVMDTAFWVAHYRAQESARPDALFYDPLAARLAGNLGSEVARGMPMSGMTAWVIAIRTRIIDQFVKSAIAQNVDVILNLGAGLDARPYRMDLPESLLWIEADFAKTIEYKETQLAGEKPRCRLERIKIDLSDVPQRQAMFAGVNARAKKLMVITEGLIPYLSVDEVGSLADDIRGLDRACFWITEYMSPTVRKHRQRLEKAMRNAPFKFWPADWFGFFASHGWEPEQVCYTADEADRVNRPFPLPLHLKPITVIRSLFLSPKNERNCVSSRPIFF